MRTLTAIGKQNESFFAPFLMGIPISEGILRFGVIEDQKACGALAASVSQNDATLLQLYIAEPSRKKGHASALLSAFLKLMKSAGVPFVYASYGKDEVMDHLLTSQGFFVLPGDEIVRLLVEDLLVSEEVKKLRRREIRNPHLHPLSALSPKERSSMHQLLETECITNEDYSAFAPDPELSAVIFKEEKATALLLAKKDEGRCLVQFLCNADPNAPLNAQNLMIHLTQQILIDPDLYELCFYAEEDHMLEFAERLVGDPKLIRRESLTSIASLTTEVAS